MSKGACLGVPNEGWRRKSTRCFAKPITGCLEKGLGAVDLQLGVFARDFFFEGIIGKLSFVKPLCQILVKDWINQARLCEVLPEGRNHGRMFRKGKPFLQQEHLCAIEHGVVGSRDRKIIQPALKKNFRSLDASLGFRQNLRNDVRHDLNASLAQGDRFTTDVHEERVLTGEPCAFTDRNQADKAVVPETQFTNQTRASVDLSARIVEIIEDRRHVDVGVIGCFAPSVGTEQQQPLEPRAVQLRKASLELSQDLLQCRVLNDVHSDASSLRELQRDVNAV